MSAGIVYTAILRVISVFTDYSYSLIYFFVKVDRSIDLLVISS